MIMIQSKYIKIKAWFFLGVFISELTMPLQTLALTSGPSQPEVHSFEPVTTNQMVDLFSGDFTYNLPLLTVPGPNGGYPINIAYHSGISMEQEASWVGLGWNLSPGVINREMRGLPDDFKQARVKKRQYTKTNRTYSIGADAFSGAEALGLDFDIGLGMSIMYNNYKGVGIGANFSTTTSVSKGTTSLGLSNNLNFDPYSGLGYSPSISISKNFRNSKSALTYDVGVQFSAIEGYQGFSTGVNYTKVTRELKGGPQKYKSEPGRKNMKTLKRSLKRMFKDKSTSRTLTSGTGASANVRAASTFSPSAEFPTKNKSYTLSFKPGGSGAGLFAKPKFDATYSENKFYRNTETYSAFGFMNLEYSDDRSLIDFNREQRTVTKNTRFLPFPNATYDFYQVKGQGIGGVFKPVRPEIVKLHEPGYEESSGQDGSFDFELGAGFGVHVGTDLYYTTNDLLNTTIGNNYGGKGKSNAKPFYEPFYFQSSGEIAQSSPIQDEKRAPRVQQMSYRTISEMEHSPRYKELFYSNYQNFLDSDVHANLADQIGELTVSGPNGMRYVYGIPAYNNTHEDYTTALSSTDKIEYDGVELANITNGHLTLENGKGTDEFYSESTIPKYAYSYLLTSLYSQDYVDLKNDGPTEDDLGYYVHFNYNKHADNFKWRSPYIYGSYSEANIGLNTDDKGSISYGNKEIYYLESIETKTHIAKFTTEARKDGYEAYGKVSDATNIAGTTGLKALQRIDLYSKLDQNTPIKTVHFEYDNSLCKGVYNHEDYSQGTPADDTGKLTLKKVYFTYGKSAKGTLNPYEFTYSSFNPDYSPQSMDRWGNYKPQTVNGISSKRNPYVRQESDDINDDYALAWNLTNIHLPSGGKLAVSYEPDDYQFVQDKPVRQMMQVTDIDYNSGKVTFKYHPDQIQYGSISDYFTGINDLYFKVYNKLKEYPTGHPNKTGGITHGYDYVEGYGTVDHSKPKTIVSSAQNTASFYVKKVKLKKHKVTPFQQAAIHKLKLERFDVLTNPPMSDNGTYSIIDGIVLAAEFFGEQLETLIAGYLNHAYDKNYGKGGDFANTDYPSFIRLNCPNKTKFGGGSRVQQIEVHDNWDTFTSNQESGHIYGKQYVYKLEDGTSSGVAENEPVFGDEESALRKPFRTTVNDVYLHDEIMTDREIASSVRPAAGVGYSRVIERSIAIGNQDSGSGQIVSEFYTAKDYPFYTKATPRTKNNTGPKAVKVPLVGSTTKDYQSYAQHYSVKKNDMHGKAKRTIKYKTGDILYSEPGITYTDIPFYERTTYYYHDQNTLPVLYGHRKGENKEIGVSQENYMDTKYFSSFTEGLGGQVNADAGVLPPGLTFTANARIDLSDTRFQTAVTSSITNRNGILDRVTLERDGSNLTTQNDAYDARTGVPLITSTFNEFGDKVSEYNIPGHWYYPTMAGSSVNNRAELSEWSNYSISGNTLTLEDIDPDHNIFIEGDQVEIQVGSTVQALWVNTVTFDQASETFDVELGNSNGTTISGLSGDLNIMVVQSANKNLANVKVGYLEYMSDKRIAVLNYLSQASNLQGNGTAGLEDNIYANNPDPNISNYFDLEMSYALNPIRLPNDPCEDPNSTGSSGYAYAFFNIDSLGYNANDTTQTMIDYHLEPNSFTLFNYQEHLTLLPDFTDFNSLLYDCKATILFPDTFVTDFINAGGATDPVFGSMLNYDFEYIGDNQVRMRINDPNISGPFEYEYICDWDDPLGCFDQCIMPLNASATIFENDLKDEYTNLASIEGENSITLDDANANPYRYGLYGTWRAKRDYVYQIGRRQAGNQGQNTDLRTDGVYDDFTFFDWNAPTQNTLWTWTNEMTKYSPYGFNLETKNALDIYSSNLIGYNESLVLASAENAQYFEIGNENFEETHTGSTYVVGSGNLEFTPISTITLTDIGHTGKRGLQGACKVDIPSMATSYPNPVSELSFNKHKTYVLSFWAKDGELPSGTGNYGTRVEIKQGSTLLTNENLQSITVDGWKKYEYVYKGISDADITISFLSEQGSDVVLIDDVRIHPFNASMATYVYDPINYRYIASLDGQNLATLYSYDQEGKLTQIKKETSKGIQTLQQSQERLKPQAQ